MTNTTLLLLKDTTISVCKQSIVSFLLFSIQVLVGKINDTQEYSPLSPHKIQMSVFLLLSWCCTWPTIVLAYDCTSANVFLAHSSWKQLIFKCTYSFYKAGGKRCYCDYLLSNACVCWYICMYCAHGFVGLVHNRSNAQNLISRYCPSKWLGFNPNTFVLQGVYPDLSFAHILLRRISE